jgi:hypothetical protein
MKFIEFDGPAVNLDQVRKITPLWARDADKRSVCVIYTDGTMDSFKGQCAYSAAENLEDRMAPIIPAAPGFQLLRFWFHDAEPNAASIIDDQFVREPIIAWRIRPYSCEAIGLEAEGPEYDAGVEAILQPNGMVVDPGNNRWKDINAWADDVCERWKKWREKKKQKDEAA